MGTGAVGNSNEYEYVEMPDPITEAIPPGNVAEKNVVHGVEEGGRMAESWQLLGNADVNRDGREETFYLDKSQINEGCVMVG